MEVKMRPLNPSTDYQLMINLLEDGPRSRWKLRNIRLVGQPNSEKWAQFFSQKGKWIGYCIFTEDESEMLGVALGMTVENFWDKLIIGRVIVWAVHERARGWNSIIIMRQLIRWFQEKQVSYIIASCDFDSQAEKVYAKLGFKPLEQTMYLLKEA